MPGQRLTLRVRILIFQAVAFALVLVVVATVLVLQQRLTTERSAQARLLTVTEYVASTPSVRHGIATDNPVALANTLQSLATLTDEPDLMATDPDNRVLAAPRDPRRVGRTLESLPRDGSAWRGTEDVVGVRSHAARVPVVADNGQVVGAIVSARAAPTMSAVLLTAVPNLLTYLAAGSVIGLGAVYVLARNIKRQTWGLEPHEIAAIATHRDALLHGMVEGILATDSRGVVTLANDSARRLLRADGDPTGRPVRELGLPPDLALLLTEADFDPGDVVFSLGGDLLVISRARVRSRDGSSETVTAIRDRTELVRLSHALDDSRVATDTLRAQSHEFRNRLHAISMLTQLGDKDAVLDLIESIGRERAEVEDTVLSRIREPAVAALVLAKSSEARDRGVRLTLDPASSLAAIGGPVAGDLVSIIGNLLDNAVDAAAGGRDAEVRLRVDHGTDASLHLQVDDTGSGIGEAALETLRRVGQTSKSTREVGGRGFGLALVHAAAARHCGTVSAGSGDLGGARFEVSLVIERQERPQDLPSSR